MTFHTAKFSAPKPLLFALLALMALTGSVLPSLAQAQTVYRSVGPDGKVTFSDQAPPASANPRATSTNAGAGGAGASASLPFELRQVASKYPVVLYTGDNCTPCMSARTMLTSRGIPFSEKTVTTNDDTSALQRLSGDTSLPFLTIGSQQLKGFSDAEWTQFLNAAGYPSTSVLPANYRAAPATPLVSVAAAPVAPPAAAPRAPQSPQQSAPVQSADNPSGIKF